MEASHPCKTASFSHPDKNGLAPHLSSIASLQDALGSEVSLSVSIFYQIFMYRLYYETRLLFINNGATL